MPLSGWLKSWIASQPSQKSDKIMVCESLLMELDFQMQETEAAIRERELEERRQRNGGVDYSWLVSDHPKPYEMPQLERLELEELCMKVKPEECGRVISSFRESIACQERPVSEIPRVLKAVIHPIIEGRPKEETMPEWMMRSLTNLTKIRPSRSIVPITDDINKSHSSLHTNSDQVFTISSIDDLPV